jgi:hypothetical protein
MAITARREHLLLSDRKGSGRQRAVRVAQERSICKEERRVAGADTTAAFDKRFAAREDQARRAVLVSGERFE